MYVWYDTTCSNSCAAQVLVKFFVVLHSQQDVTGGNALLLVVLGAIADKLKKLCSQALFQSEEHLRNLFLPEFLPEFSPIRLEKRRFSHILSRWVSHIVCRFVPPEFTLRFPQCSPLGFPRCIFSPTVASGFPAEFLADYPVRVSLAQLPASSRSFADKYFFNLRST